MSINDNLWAWWRFEEDGTDNRVDSSGGGHTLVYVPQTDFPSRPDPIQTDGKIGYATRILHSLNSSIDPQGGFKCTAGMPSPAWSNKAFTMALWFRCPNVTTNVNQWQIPTYPWALGVEPGMQLKWVTGHANGYLYCATEGKDVTTAEIVTPNVYHLVIFYSTGVHLHVDFDGVNVANNLTGAAIGRILGTRVCVASAAGNGTTIYQDFDEFRIWERMLDDGERDSLWNGGGGFDPIGSGGVYGSTLVQAKDLMEGRRGWFYDTYTPNVMVHYGEEGPNVHSILCGAKNGGIYQLTGEADDINSVSCKVTTASRDQGDTRYNKLYGDIMVDCNTGGVAVTATPKFDNDSVSSAAVTVNTATRTQVPVPVGTEWQTARNISLDLAWTMNGTRSYFYIWEPRYTEEGGKIFAYDWETCFITHELPGYFYHGYLYLVHISTANLTFTITDESGTVKTATVIPHSAGLHSKSFIRLPVVKGKLFKYRLSSTAQFRVEGQESELLVKPWGMGGPWQRQRIFEDVAHGEAQ